MYLSHDLYNCFEKYVTMVKYYYGNIVTMAKSISLSHYAHVLPSQSSCVYCSCKNIININTQLATQLRLYIASTILISGCTDTFIKLLHKCPSFQHKAGLMCSDSWLFRLSPLCCMKHAIQMSVLYVSLQYLTLHWTTRILE